jgi:hypothetical protein
MRVPQVKERVKESPASALRAMFAGIGSMLFVKDKIRHKADAGNSTPATEAAAPATAAAAETPAAPEPAVAEPVVAEPVVAEPVVAETVAAETVAAETTAVPDVSAGPETTAAPEATVAPAAAALPLANYDELTIASLRARLRNLSAEQLTELIGYEREHANREDVISMFERRITKLNLGLTQALPKATE